MAGNVFLFNTYATEGVTLFLNGYPLGTMPAAASGTYAPSSLSVPRNPSTGNPGQAQFGGSNSLVVSYGTSGNSIKYPIDGISYAEVPQEHDLQLYLYFNLAILVKESMAAPVAIPGEAPSAEELELAAR
jgi:hypothetical protein